MRFDEYYQYKIRVKEKMDPAWSNWFDNLVVKSTTEDETELTGVICDQAALFGVLNKIRDLGLTLQGIFIIIPVIVK